MAAEMRQRFFEDFFDKDFGLPGGGRKLANKIVPRELQNFVKVQSGQRLFLIRGQDGPSSCLLRAAINPLHVPHIHMENDLVQI